MKPQSKVQQYQTDAVDIVVETFAGQPKHDDIPYRIGSGKVGSVTAPALFEAVERPDAGLCNVEIVLSSAQLLGNIHTMQRSRNLPLSAKLVSSTAVPGAPNFNVEVETGTGKTYVYIKTIMELHKRYNWSKYIIVVSSVIIREGMKESFDMTAEHFQQLYGTKPRSFICNSSQLHELERFSSDAGVQVMIINIQAFNTTDKDNRRIYDELDDFQSCRPVDVINANRPIVIVDEPQKIGTPKSLEALSWFNALMLFRYSVTRKVNHTKVCRLGALDAYNQKLVKKTAVWGTTVKGLVGSTAYLYLSAIEVAKGARPRARTGVGVQTATGIRRQIKRLDVGANLHDVSNEIKAYRRLFIVEIDTDRDVIELSSGNVVAAGQLANRDVTEETRRRIQIHEVVRAHLDKKRELFSQSVKILSLFFIDEIAKYRDCSRQDTLGGYARMFEEKYAAIRGEMLGGPAIDAATEEYQVYLRHDDVRQTHKGYFSIDKKTKHQVDGKVSRRDDDKGQSTDADAYDLILKDKEWLLSFVEPVRFIFFHSAPREGWDNPNMFVMGILKKSDNTVSHRQETGRGLRLSVDQHGRRVGNPVTIHDISELTIMADESYADFVTGLQREISEPLAARSRKASVVSSVDKAIQTPSGELVIGETIAQALCKYLTKSGYVNDDNTIADAYRQAKKEEILTAPTSEVLKSIIDLVQPLIGVLYLDLPVPTDDRRPKKIPLNEANLARKGFQELWGRINHRVVYQIGLDSTELIRKAIAHLDRHPDVAALQYVIRTSRQRGQLKTDDLTSSGPDFTMQTAQTHIEIVNTRSQVKYGLLGEVTEKARLTRRTIAAILSGVMPGTFAKFHLNPEQFITEAARSINEQKATVIVEHLTYDALGDRFDSAIFTENQTVQDFSETGAKLKKHIYDCVVTGSRTERRLVTGLDTGHEVAVYTKLPRGFFVLTPADDCNPGWAITFTEGSIKHLYFVTDIKSSLSILQLKSVENARIECAREFFASLSEKNGNDVTYDVAADYTELMQLIAS